MDLYDQDKVGIHFLRSEFACKCGCGFAAVDVKLIKVLTDVREHFGVPVTITSGCRCESHNRKVGGSEGSFHLKGMAADILVKGVPPGDVHEYLDDSHPHKFGIGLYVGWVHIDVRPTKARW